MNGEGQHGQGGYIEGTEPPLNPQDGRVKPPDKLLSLLWGGFVQDDQTCDDGEHACKHLACLEIYNYMYIFTSSYITYHTYVYVHSQIL